MFKIIGSAKAKYLAATDVLIGDMSNINYEFLLFNRPILLLANDWVRNHFPDIGIKARVHELEDAILRSLENPTEFEDDRKFWLKKVIFLPEISASKYYIDIAIQNTNFDNPKFVLLDGNNSVRKTNLEPLYNELTNRNIEVEMVNTIANIKDKYEKTIFIAAHFTDLIDIDYGYCIHIDHDLKGPATANLSQAVRDYKKNNYFDNIHLHISGGVAGKYRTQYVLGDKKDRVVIGGYPKADDLLAFNYYNVKKEVCNELGFDPSKPLVTYAPAGEKTYMKPGGSLSIDVIKKIKEFGEKNSIYNILIKVKYEEKISPKEIAYNNIKKIYSGYRSLRYSDGGKEWDNVIQHILD